MIANSILWIWRLLLFKQKTTSGRPKRKPVPIPNPSIAILDVSHLTCHQSTVRSRKQVLQNKLVGIFFKHEYKAFLKVEHDILVNLFLALTRKENSSLSTEDSQNATVPCGTTKQAKHENPLPSPGCWLAAIQVWYSNLLSMYIRLVLFVHSTERTKYTKRNVQIDEFVFHRHSADNKSEQTQSNQNRASRFLATLGHN